jgi:hypothetical protein
MKPNNLNQQPQQKFLSLIRGECWVDAFRKAVPKAGYRQRQHIRSTQPTDLE